MRTHGMRFGAAGLLIVAGLLASCTTAPPRPAAQSQRGTRPAGTRAHAQPTAGSGLQVSRGPWWSRGITPCTAPALVRVGGHVLGVGTCTGQLSIPGLKVTLALGQRIDVHMTNPPWTPLPHSSRPSVLAPGAVSRDGSTQTYRADHPGQAVLVSDARGCFVIGHPEAGKTARSCPVAVVTVVP